MSGWQLRAACLDHPKPDLWFPTPGDVASRDAAQRICKICPVQLQCVELCLKIGAADGIWGGLTQNQISRLTGDGANVRRQLAAAVDPCGTPGAYARHGRNGEAPCRICRQANALRVADRKARR